MERCVPFKAYIVDTEEVMTVYYAGSTGHDMIDYFKDKYGNHYHRCYDNIKNAPKNIPIMELFYVYDADSIRKENLQKCEDALHKNMTFDIFFSKTLLTNLFEKRTMGVIKKVFKGKGGKGMKHIEISCNSLAECYARLRDCDLIYVSDLGKKAKIVIDIDTDSPFDGSFINIPD